MRPDYRIYRLSRTNRWICAGIGCAACFAAMWLLYRHLWIAAVAAPLGLKLPRLYANALRDRRQAKLRGDFKDALQALSSLLAAGRSVENAFRSLEDELALTIGDTRSDFVAELRAAVNRMANGEPLEAALSEFAGRSGVEEIGYFAETISIGKRSGGNLVEVVRQSSRLIGEKLDAELEVSVLLAQKKFESKLMMGMPFAFVGGLSLIADEYLSPLREGAGLIVLTVCLLALLGCCRWMFHIMDIRL